MNKRRIAYGAALLATMIGVPDSHAARHVTTSQLVHRAHQDPYACDFDHDDRYGRKQLECVIRIVWPRRLANEAISVAECESGGGYLLADPPPNPSSTAKGLFQFLDSTWRTTPQYRLALKTARSRGIDTYRARSIAAELVRDPVANTRGARWLYRTGGHWRQWQCRP